MFNERLNLPNIGLHDWLMTSRQTEPDLSSTKLILISIVNECEMLGKKNGDIKTLKFRGVYT